MIAQELEVSLHMAFMEAMCRLTSSSCAIIRYAV